MHFLTTTVLAGLAASLASAQTHTNCDPTKKACPNDPAIGTPFTSDFKTGRSALEGWAITANDVTFTDAGAAFTINKRGDAPTIQTNGYFQFGYAEVKMKAASGQGIISSIVLESDDLDEVDWEFIGGTDSNVQTNYFGKGNTTTYDRMIPYNVATPQETMHTFALNWTAESLTWLIDNVPQRTLHYADAVGGKNYPQTPMNLRIGIWAGGDPSNSPGTISWAGGLTDYTKAPFTMTVESVKIINYSPGKEYQWTDMSGSFESIKVIGGGDNSGGVSSSAIPSSAPAASASVSAGLGSQIDTPSSSISTVVRPATATGAVSVPVVSHSDGCTEGASMTVVVPSGSATAPAATVTPSGTASFSGALPVTQISDGQIQVPPPPTAISSGSTLAAVSTGIPSYPTTLSPAESASTPCNCPIVTVTITSGSATAPITLTPTPSPSTPAASVPAPSSAGVPVPIPSASSISSIPSIPKSPTTLAPASTATPVYSGAVPVTQISDGQIQVPPAPTSLSTLAAVSTGTGSLTAIPYPTTPIVVPTSGLVTETLPAPSKPGISGYPSGGNGTKTATGSVPQFTGAAVMNAANGILAAAVGVVAVLVM